VSASGDGICARGIVKRFGSTVALDGVDLDVARGEVVVVLGRNGAGKSTLLRILGTTVLPDAGVATVAGHDVVRAARDARRQTGMVLGDERSWYWRLSGRANLEFFGALHGFDRARQRRRAVELLELVHLEDAADRRFDGYSAGMRARLSLARALLASPAVLLLDEPTSALDPVVGAELRVLIRDLAHDEQRAVLWVTHDLEEAVAVADRVIVIEHGHPGLEHRQPIDTDGLRDLFDTEAAS
jgi:ABC-type multidrug transport system ATPase subunit